MVSWKLIVIPRNKSLLKSIERSGFESVWKSGDRILILILPGCFVHRVLVLLY